MTHLFRYDGIHFILDASYFFHEMTNKNTEISLTSNEKKLLGA